MMNRIIKYLDELYPNAKCELEYSKDYELLIAIVLSAQTTDKRVNKVTKELFTKYNNINELNNANISDIVNIIKSLGSYTKKSEYIKDITSKIVANNNEIPNDRQFLESIKGVGRKSANVFLSNIYQVPCIAVDTHVERVSKRLGLSSAEDSVLEVEHKLMDAFPQKRWIKLHHQLVLFGRYKCKAIKPNCLNCEFKDICNYKK